MRTRQKLVAIVSLVVIISMIITSYSTAGWVDDWLSSSTSVAPTSFEGQKRGYFTLGSFSARRSMSTDKIFTFSPPRVKFGCGGIDLFLGGFSFLNPEHLVQKFQNILSAAPAAAFDIALNNLCEPCAKTIKSLEAIVDKLNSLQIDDCAMSRALAVKVMKPLSPEKLAAEDAEADKTLNITKGIKDLAYEVDGIWKTDPKPTQNLADSTKGVIAGCPQDVRELITPGTLVLEKLLSRLKFSTAYSSLVRGYVGDIFIESVNNSGPTPTFVPRCIQNDPTRVDNFIIGNAYERKNHNAECTQIIDKNASIYNYVYEKILSIYNRIKNKQQLNRDEQDFINKVPTPLLLSIKTAVETGADSVVLTQLADLTARYYAAMMLTDLYINVQNALEKAKELRSKTGYNRENCRTEYVERVLDNLEQLQKNILDFATNVRKDVVASASNFTAISSVIARLERQNEVFERLVQKYLGEKSMR